MADPPKGKGLARKLGPFPIWLWLLIAVGVYYWYTHYGPGAKKQKGKAGKPSRPAGRKRR